MSLFKPGLLAGQTAVLTGGSSGISLGMARRLAEHGANVAIVARQPDRLAAAAIDIGSRNGGRVMTCSVDVRQYEALSREMDRVAAHFGPVDMVIAGAAGNFPAPAADMSANAFAAVIGIDLLGTYNTFRALHRHLRRPGARLVAISAPQAQHPLALQAHACAAKAGIEQLVRSLALEWGPEGIRVNALSPGFVAGTVGGSIMGEARSDHFVSRLPIARWTSVDEVADFMLFMLSPVAAYMTGQVCTLDGGFSLLRGDMSALAG